MLMLLDCYALVSDWLDSDAMANRIFILQRYYDFVLSTCADTSEHGLRRHHVQRALKRVMENSRDHRISLVDELSKGLFLIDGTKNHLVLALFANVLN